MKQGDIIEIKWLDAWANSHGRWDPHFAYGPLIMKNIGYFVSENDEGILLAGCEQRKGDCYVGETFTTWEMVVSLEVLV